MTGTYTFLAMRRYKEHKFDQEKAGRIAFSVPGGILRRPGVCAPASLLWIEDRLTRPTTIFGNRPNIFSNKPGDTTDNTHTRLLQRAATLGSDYYNNPYVDGNDLSSMENQLRITKVKDNQQIPSFPLGDLVGELVSIVSELKNGEAAAISMIPASGAHMIACYRSQAGHNYLFDPNTGVYKFSSSEIQPFLSLWANCYTQSEGEFQRFSGGRSFAYFSTYSRM